MNAAATAIRPQEESSRVSGRSVLAVVGLWLASAVALATAGWYLAAQLTGGSETPALVAVFLVYLLLPLSALVVYRMRGVRDRLAVGAAEPR